MTILMNRKWPWAIVVSLAAAVVACGPTASPQERVDAAAAPTAAWTKAFNAGEPAALAALYADDARMLPPGGPAVAGRNAIQLYWRDDLGEGGVTTTLTPVDTVARQDLVHVEGTYQVKGGDGADVAGGQYQQLWTRSGETWQVEREMWRIDSALQRDPLVAERLTTAWTNAYNAADAKALLALYAEDAAVSTTKEGTVNGKPAIEAFWTFDLGGNGPSSTLTLTDVYITGELAHLEGEYKVADSGKITDGRSFNCGCAIRRAGTFTARCGGDDQRPGHRPSLDVGSTCLQPDRSHTPSG
jgi:ketosteroid isomerase-like protein